MSDDDVPLDGSHLDGHHASSFTETPDPDEVWVRRDRVATALKGVEHMASRTADDAEAEGMAAAIDYIRNEVRGL